MRKVILGVLASAAMAWTSAANAAVSITPIDSVALNADGTSHFGATFSNELSFTDLAFSFVLDAGMMTNGSVITFIQLPKDIDFSSIYIDVNDTDHAFHQTGFDPNPESWGLSPDIFLGAGEHTIYLSGNLHAPGNGSFGGDINIGAVPEPATWAMMLIGFGAIGGAMRRRRRQLKVQFA